MISSFCCRLHLEIFFMKQDKEVIQAIRGIFQIYLALANYFYYGTILYCKWFVSSKYQEVQMKTDFDKINEWLIQLFHDCMNLEEQFLKDSDYPDVTVKELQQMTLIHTLGTCRATDIARNQKLALSTITITLNCLETKGYIKRERSDRDRRVAYIVLTEKGMALCASHSEFFRSISEKLMLSVYGTTENKLAGELEELHKSLENMK